MSPAAGTSSIAFSPGRATRLAIGTQEGSLAVWGLQPGDEPMLLRPHGDRINALAFSPDGNLLASGSEDGTVKLWSAASGDEIEKLRSDGQSAVETLAWRPDGQQLAIGDADATAVVWDLDPVKKRRTHRHDEAVRHLSFSPDGRYLVTFDGTARIWDIQSGTAVFRLPSLDGAVVSPGGRRLLAIDAEGGMQIVEAHL